MASGPSGYRSGVEIRGLAEFRRALRDADGDWPKELTKAHKEIGDLGARYAREKAAAMGGVQARAKSAIGGKGTQTEARIGVFPSGVDRMANVAFFGAKRHTGWYADPRYAGSPAQHPKWVGDGWEPAVSGQGPYAINDALAEHLDEILDEYDKAIARIAAAAFPEGG